MVAKIMLAGLGVTSALNVGASPRVNTRATGVNMADIIDTAKSLQGPDIFWGSEGPMVGKEESEIKGYDNFGKFVAAVEAAGLTDALKGAGPMTVLAPSDSAFDNFQGEITADILKYHVIPQKVTTSTMGSDLPTLQGGTLKYRRFARKDFLDSAMVGVKSAGPSKSQNWPSDVECDNGVIHSIDTVLVPGAFTE